MSIAYNTNQIINLFTLKDRESGYKTKWFVSKLQSKLNPYMKTCLLFKVWSYM